MNYDKYDQALAEQAAREHRHECAMFEVDILVTGTRREIYHIATKQLLPTSFEQTTNPTNK